MSSLKNLSTRITTDKDPLDAHLPPGIKIAEFRRNLIMSGLQYADADYTKEEGELVIKAISNYRVDTGNAPDEEDLEEKSFRKELSKCLLGIKKDHVYESIQFRKRMEEANYKQD